MGNIFQATEELRGHLTLDRYGFSEYVRWGFLSPGQSLIAPREIYEAGYGDCNIFVQCVVDMLIRHNIHEGAISVWLIRLPYRQTRGGLTSIEHTITAVEANSDTYLVGFTPYDRLVMGQQGVVELSKYPVMLRGYYMREQLTVTEFSRRLAQRFPLAAMSYDASRNTLCVSEREEVHDNEVPIIIEHSTCLGRAPMAYDVAKSVFVEAGVQGGIRNDRPAYKYNYHLIKDIFNAGERRLEGCGLLAVEFKLDAVHLPDLQAFVKGLEPEQVYHFLTEPSRRPRFLTVEVADDDGNPAVHETAHEQGGVLQRIILNTFIPETMNRTEVIARLRARREEKNRGLSR